MDKIPNMNMSIGLNEWNHAKELLVRLAQALSPKVAALERAEGIPFFADEVLKRPFRRHSTEWVTHHTIRLLPTLQIAQKEMARWIEILPNEGSVPGENGSARPTYGTDKIAAQAKTLALEVRVAIQNLSTSAYLSDPRPDPLRRALAKLKPLVDEMIDSIAKTTQDRPKEKASVFSADTSGSRMIPQVAPNFGLFREFNKKKRKRALFKKREQDEEDSHLS